MEDKEIVEYLKKSDLNTQQLKISACIATFLDILIKNKITTREEYNKKTEEYLELIRYEQVKRMTPEEKQTIETNVKLEGLFGKFV